MSNFNFRTMKTNRLLKITLSIAITFLVSTISFGQSIPTDLAEDTDSSATDHVTAGYSVPYYVTPDPTLNSSYSAPYEIGVDDQGFSSTWEWQVTGTATANTINQGGSADDHPYVEVEWGTPGSNGEQAFIETREIGPSGSCNGEWKGLEVNVYNPPQFDFTNAGSGTPTDTLYEVCASNVSGGQDVQVQDINDNGIPASGNYKFRLDLDVYTVDAANAHSTGSGTEVRTETDTIVEVGVGSGVETSNPATIIPNYSMNAVGGNITRYRFDFGSTIDGANANGITDPIQRKSYYLQNPNANDTDWDYLADSNNDTEGSMVTFIVYPAPETGNIHYVPNDFDL